MKEKEFVKLFKEIESFDRRVETIESLVGGSIKNSNDTVLFVDEVQESEEFLEATNNTRFIKLIKDSFNSDTALALPIHNKLLDLFYKYLYLGGMPSVIQNFCLFSTKVLL